MKENPLFLLEITDFFVYLQRVYKLHISKNKNGKKYKKIV